MDNAIRQYIPDSKNMDYSDVVTSGRRIEALDYDPDRKVVYWTDSSELNIKWAGIPEDVTQRGYAERLPPIGINEPNGIAFDWVAK